MTKVAALLLAVWYCVSIIGFDVHTCKGSGRTFVATFAEGMTCADIHPEHRCGHACHHEFSGCHHDSSCCRQESDCCSSQGNQSGECVGSQDCCTDSYQVILLTGCRGADDGQNDDDYVCCPYVADCASCVQESLKYKPSVHYYPDSGDIAPCDRRVTFGVWRI